MPWGGGRRYGKDRSRGSGSSGAAQPMEAGARIFGTRYTRFRTGPEGRYYDWKPHLRYSN